MKILFAIKSLSHFSYMSSFVESLYKCGHKVDFLFDKEWSKRESSKCVDEFLKKTGYTANWMERRTDRWRQVAFLFRELKSCSSYLKRNTGSMYYRNRWFGYIPFVLRPFIWIFFLFYKYLHLIENLIPPEKNIVRKLIEYDPDVVIATPCNHRFSEEIEYIKAAKSLGIKTVIPVLSWDNLTTKGIFHAIPDKLLVWNESQKQEAIEIHGIPHDNIEIIGSPFFDKWFCGETRLENRVEFCKSVGLNPWKPYCLYLGSSSNIAKDETWIIEKLSSEFSDISFLVRPHPANYKNFLWVNLNNVVVYPKNGRLVDDADSLNSFYNEIKHSAFVFGINTSGMIDAIINDKACVTLLADEYKHTQSDAVHFEYMKDAIYMADSFDSLFKFIRSLLNGELSRQKERRKFVGNFIRPENAVSVDNVLSGLGKEYGSEGEHNRVCAWMGESAVQ